MNIPDRALELATDAVIDAAFGQELPEAPIDLARAALEAGVPIVLKVELLDLADLIAPNSGIGLANGATRADIALWLRTRTETITEGLTS